MKENGKQGDKEKNIKTTIEQNEIKGKTKIRWKLENGKKNIGIKEEQRKQESK